MPTRDRQLTDVDRVVMKRVLDLIIPPIDDFPGAGGLGLSARVEKESLRYARLRGALLTILFAALDEDRQISSLKTVEVDLPTQFSEFIELVYEIYYTDSRVHEHIGWVGRPPQPEGFDIGSWDPAILENARKREPFWRKV